MSNNNESSKDNGEKAKVIRQLVDLVIEESETNYYFPDDQDEWDGLDWDVYFGLTNPEDL